VPTERDLLHVLRAIRGRLDANPTLRDLSARAGWSRFHLHRDFRRMVGETPKAYTLRLRLERAAVRLVTTGDTVLQVALDGGFASHEVFTRAFRRHFGETPARYRAAALARASRDTRARHGALIETTGPCIGLFHFPVDSTRRRPSVMPTLSIVRQELAAQPMLFVRVRAGRDEIAKSIGESLGKAFPFAQMSGVGIAGRPFTRYLSTGPGLYEMEIGVPVAAAVAGDGDVQAGTLPGGPVAVAVHGGPYDQLSETFAALQRWIEAGGLRIAGPPWESYVTDPAEFPDPADWRTEVYWPVA
jgi:AraC family transcriptional regulator